MPTEWQAIRYGPQQIVGARAPGERQTGQRDCTDASGSIDTQCDMPRHFNVGQDPMSLSMIRSAASSGVILAVSMRISGFSGAS